MRSLSRGPAAARFLFLLAFVPAFLVALTAPAPWAAQDATERVAWNQPVEPFRVIGNVHYVGAAGVSAFLITTAAGSFLLDGGLPETAPLIARNIAALGLKLADVKLLLNSHAHFDHAGGLRELQQQSGAALAASAADRAALEAGGPQMPAVRVTRLVQDGERLTLGDTTLTAHITPGHTPGCTTWTTTVTEGGRPYTVIFYCSTSVVDALVDNSRYPGIVADYQQTFARLRGMKADVFLANHPAFFDLAAKQAKRAAAAANPFIDTAELLRFVDTSERQFQAELKKAQAARQ